MASLARATFKREFLYNQKDRRSIAGMAQQFEPAPLSLTFALDRFELLSHPRYRPPALLIIKEIPFKCSTRKTSAGFIKEISYKMQHVQD